MGFCLGSNSDECKDECTPSTPPEWWGAVVVICLEQGADLHMAQLMPLPLTVSCFSKIQIGLPFWYRLTRYQKGKKAVKRVCVCKDECSYKVVAMPPFAKLLRTLVTDW